MAHVHAPFDHYNHAERQKAVAFCLRTADCVPWPQSRGRVPHHDSLSLGSKHGPGLSQKEAYAVILC
jgi:hypothetical protein